MQPASQKVSQTVSYVTRQNRMFAEKNERRRGRVFTNDDLRPGMPPCPSLWVWVEPVSLVLLPWRISMVDHRPRPPRIGIRQASAPVPLGHSQTSQTFVLSWPWLAALWSPSAALLLSATPQTGRRHSRCLLRTEAASPSSCTHSGISCEHESSSCHGILLETLNWRSCLQSIVNQVLLHFEMLPWPNLSLSSALPLRECPTQLLVQSWWRQCA